MDFTGTWITRNGKIATTYTNGLTSNVSGVVRDINGNDDGPVCEWDKDGNSTSSQELDLMHRISGFDKRKG